MGVIFVKIQLYLEACSKNKNRRLNWKIDVEKNNENQIFIKDHQIYNLSKIVIEELKVDKLEKIKIARSKNKEVVRIVEKMKRAEVRKL